MLKKVYLPIEIGSTVYLVFTSKREGAKDNVIVKCKVDKVTVYEDETVYSCKLLKVVSKAGEKDIKKWVSSFCFKNANIDTGYRGFDKRYYPVFTIKEKCLEWIKN